jgi:hypothetical protein
VTTSLEPRSGDTKTCQPVSTTAGKRCLPPWPTRRPSDSYRWESQADAALQPPRCGLQVVTEPGSGGASGLCGAAVAAVLAPGAK